MSTLWVEKEYENLTKGLAIEKVAHDLPSFEFVVQDSPTCHQSLAYWGHKSKEVRKSIGEVASCLNKYHTTGLTHKESGEALSDSFLDAAKTFKDDPQFHDPLNKFADAMNRIECYKEMLLNQTHMLGVHPLNEMVRGIKKDKELKTQLKKSNESYHVAWDKFAHCAHLNNLQEPSHLDKSAQTFLNARENYQLHLATYIKSLRETHTVKQVLIMQRLLEHMLAQFSFFNFSYQIMKELEPYMSEVFENLKTKFNTFEGKVKEDFAAKQSILEEAQRQTFEDKKLFPLGDHSGFHGASTMQSINASTGKFFTRVGGLFSSGVQGVRGKPAKDTTDSKSRPSEPDWEVIDTPDKKKHRESDISIEEPTGFLKSAKEVMDESDGTKSSRAQFYFSLEEENKKKGELQGQGSDTKADDSGISSDLRTKQDEDLMRKHDDLDHEDSVLSLTDFMGHSNGDSSLTKRESQDDSLYKRGYLRIKQKAFPKSRFPLLYFIVDKKNGELMAQGEDQPYPSLFCSLMLSTVKECDPEETDRNFCFQVITAHKDHTFQAISTEDMKDWMKAIQEGIATALNQSQERIRSIVRARSKSGSQKKKAKVYVENAAERIRAVEGNTYCCDCSTPRPDWASTNIGVVFCIECSGVHRSLGVHISKVKSLTLDRWEEEYIERMEERGNLKMNSILEGRIGSIPKATRDSSKEQRKNFIIQKYVDRKFAVPSQSDEPDGGELDLDLTFDSSVEEELFKDEVAQIPDASDLLSLRSSVLCLVEDCQDCEGGHHRRIHSPTGDFSSSLLQMEPSYEEIRECVDEGERTLNSEKSEGKKRSESQC